MSNPPPPPPPLSRPPPPPPRPAGPPPPLRPPSGFGEISVSAIDHPADHARLALTDHSLIITPNIGCLNPQGMAWEIPYSDIVLAHLNYGSAPSPRGIIISKACFCAPVSFGIQQQRVVLFKTDWFKSHESDINSGRIEAVEQKWVKVEYGGGGSPFPNRKEKVIGSYYFLKPEGYFFDPPGHCITFCLDGYSEEQAGKFLARLFALRNGKTNPQSYKSADESRQTSPWLCNGEDLRVQWKGTSAVEGLYARFVRALVGMAGGLSAGAGVVSPEGLLPKPLTALNIYLTSQRLIIEAAGQTEVEIADFPVDRVRALQWNIRPKAASLEIITDGPTTQMNSANPGQKARQGTGPSMNLPARHVAEQGGWDASLTCHSGRHFVTFDPRAAHFEEMRKALDDQLSNRQCA